jgi:hypothetical protein
MTIVSPSQRLVLTALTSVVLAAAGEPARAQATLYGTGFEPPTSAPGLLHGQDGWYVFDGISLNAATVSPGLARKRPASPIAGRVTGARVTGARVSRPARPARVVPAATC